LVIFFTVSVFLSLNPMPSILGKIVCRVRSFAVLALLVYLYERWWHATG